MPATRSGVHEGDGGYALHQRAVTLLGLPEPLLRTLALGDVPHGGDAHVAAPVGERPPPDLEVEARAVLPDPGGLVGGLGTRCDLPEHQVPVLGCDELKRRPADHLRKRVPEHVGEGAVGLEDLASVAYEDALEGRVGEAPAPLLAPAQLAVEPGPAHGHAHVVA